mgnify:CR=1 FL=1
MSDMPRILGLDEAGRGCVLGPLVIGAFCCTIDELEALDATGATDSKKLSAKKREEIRQQLLSIGEYALDFITPRDRALMETLRDRKVRRSQFKLDETEGEVRRRMRGEGGRGSGGGGRKGGRGRRDQGPGGGRKGGGGRGPGGSGGSGGRGQGGGRRGGKARGPR